MDPKVSKADQALRKILGEKRLKGVEDRRVASEVFDQNTLETLYKLANRGYLNLLKGAISTGKEANVFKGVHEEGNFLAVKIYRINTSDFKKMQYYIQGDPRFKVRTTNKRQLVFTWVNKEYRNLKRSYEAGIKVPKPILAKNNVLLMEFIGDEEGNPAPLLINKPPDNPDKAFKSLLKSIKKLYYDAKLVHGDLSAFNVLNYEEKMVIIDMSQSLVVDHPLSRELLERDLANIALYFKKFGISKTIEELKLEIYN